MNYNRFSSKILGNYVLIILYIITGSLSNFGAIDILAPQWIYLGSVNIITCGYILFYSSRYHQESFVKLFSISYIYLYIFYILWNALSYFYAVNPVETLINFPRIANTFFAIIFCYLLISKIPNKVNFIYSLFFIFLLAEMISYYYDLSEVYPKEGLRVIAIKGFAGNKNITAASIAFKIPFAIFLFLNSKNKAFKFLTFIILTAAILAISLIEARAAILSSILVFIFLVSFFIYKLVVEKNDVSRMSFKFASIFLPYIVAFVTNIFATNFANDKYRKVDITETIGKISFTEQSSNGRFNYWTDAFKYIKENPIFASGLGNWKIESIDKGKEHITGYTVPYHAHNDFIHVFAETGILGGFAYLGLFLLISFYALKILKRGYDQNNVNLKDFVLILPLIVYGIDAALNFPVARPLMQSSLAIFLGLIISIYTNEIDVSNSLTKGGLISNIYLTLAFLLLIPCIIIHIISYKSLTQQGRLLFEFNNAKYTYTRDELDKISHNFPNLTETAMPIKAMKARYYYLAGNKKEAHEMALQGNRDNPKIHFGSNLKATFFLQENQIDSAYHYAKKAFDGLPNNMPHFDIYMRTLAFKRDSQAINEAFERVRAISGDQSNIWTIYLRSLALTRSLGDPFSMAKAQEAFNMYPTNENIFQLYRILTYGQERLTQAAQLVQEGKNSFEKGDFLNASKYYLEAFDKDPLDYSHALNSALSLYNLNDFRNALKYFTIANSTKKPEILEKALRFRGLTHFALGENKEGCAQYLKLVGRFPKRMYQQEFNKYCRFKK